MSNDNNPIDRKTIEKFLVQYKKAQDKLNALTEPVAIIGMSCRFPGGANHLNSYLDLLKNGKSGIADVPASRWNIDDYYDSTPHTPGKMYVRKGGFLDVDVRDFDAKYFYMSRKEAVFLDPQHRLLLELLIESLEHACIPPDSLNKSKTGVFVAICSHDYEMLEAKKLPDSAINAYFKTGTSHSTAAGRLSYLLGLEGPCISVDTACSSSLIALHYACDSLRRKESTMAVAAGVNVLLEPRVTINFCQANMLSPDGLCKTFDASADGYVRGEGCGFVVLKRLSDAIKDGNRIFAVIRGSGTNQDGASSGLTVPNAAAQIGLMQQVLEQTQLKPSDIAYLEAHGTGTSLGDPIEANAVDQVYGVNRKAEDKLYLGAVKANIGHLEAAAGIASFIKAVLMLHEEFIPPQVNFKQINPLIKLDHLQITTQKLAWPRSEKLRRIAVSSFGYAGSNAHLILEEAPIIEKRKNLAELPSAHIIVFSAKTEQALRNHLKKFAIRLAEENNLSLADIAYTSCAGRSHHRYRIAVVVDTISNLLTQLTDENFDIVQSSEDNMDITLEFVYTESSSDGVALLNNINKTLDIALQALQDNKSEEVEDIQITLPFQATTLDAFKQLQEKLVRLYKCGVAIDWKSYFKPFQTCQFVDLPSYAFERIRIWHDELLTDTGSNESHELTKLKLSVRTDAPSVKGNDLKLDLSTEKLDTSIQTSGSACPRANQSRIKTFISLPNVEREQAFIKFVHDHVATILCVEADEIEDEQGFFELGFDSIMSTELRHQIDNDLGEFAGLSIVSAFDYPNIKALAKHIETMVCKDIEIIGVKNPVDFSILNNKKTATSSSATSSSNIAIIGMACRFPGQSNDPEAFWKLLSNGKDGIKTIPKDRWNIDDYYNQDPEMPGKMNVRKAGFIENVALFDADFFAISPREAEIMDPQQRILLEECWHALENANLIPSRLKGSSTGVFIGAWTSDYNNLMLLHGGIAASYVGVSNTLSAIAGRVAYVFGFQGPCVTLDTACSSSLVAIDNACDKLNSGECDLALAGGVNLILLPEVMIQMTKSHMLSPEGYCKTFDKDANGYGRGEGCGVVVLKRLDAAIAEGDNILAVIKATSTNQDGRSSGFTVPNGLAQEKLMQNTLEKANLNAADIDYVETHGTGTSLGDPIEVLALGHVYGKDRDPEKVLTIGSVKSNIGHLESAAGVASVIKMVLSLQNKQFPPQANFKQLNPEINIKDIPATINTGIVNWDGSSTTKRVAISSFGATGTNAHVIIEQAPVNLDKSHQALAAPHSYLLTLSAKCAESLNAYIDNLFQFIQTQDSASIADICFTLNSFRQAFEYRTYFIFSDVQDLLNQIQCKKYVIEKADKNAYYFSLSFDSGSELTIKKMISNWLSEINIAQPTSETSACRVSIPNGRDEFLSLLSELARAFIVGISIDWDSFYLPMLNSLKKVSVPNYVFHGEHHWFPFTASAQTELQQEDMSHPLLGQRLPIKGQAQYFQSILSKQNMSYLKDHIVFNKAVLPAAVYIELAAELIDISVSSYGGSISNLLIHAPFILHEQGVDTLQTIISDNNDQKTTHVEFYSMMKENDQQSWELLAECDVLTHKQSTMDVQAKKPTFENDFSAKDFYRSFSDKGIRYQQAFQTVRKVNLLQPGEVFAEVKTQCDCSSYVIHPTILDGCMQVLSVALQSITKNNDSTYLPVSVNEITVNQVVGNSCFVNCRINTADEHYLIADLTLFNARSEVVGQILGMRAQRVTQQQFNSMINYDADILHESYELVWEELALALDPQEELINNKKTYLLCVDGETTLQQDLLAAGHACTEIRVDAITQKNIIESIKDNFGNFTDLIWLVNKKHEIETSLEGQKNFLAVLQYIIKQANSQNINIRMPEVWMLTSHAAPVQQQNLISPVIHSYYGLIRTLILEYPELHCHMIDLDFSSNVVEIILNESIAKETKNELAAYRNTQRYVARVTTLKKAQTLRQEVDIPAKPYQLMSSKKGALENLYYQPVPSRVLKATEICVEISATGLNFRDVMNALDFYPGDAGPLCEECAGVVSAVGDRVSNFKVGDEVIGFIAGCTGNQVIGDEICFVKKPRSLTFAQAAAVPTVYMTVVFALRDLAKLTAKDTLFIHSAAGGVGLVAIQYAKHIGAKLIVTAGNAEKQQYLRDLGIEHVLYSRNYDYVEQVKEITSGKGVDVVLNYATGRYIEQTLKITAKNARFVEIGKRKIRTKEEMQTERPDIDYHILALDDIALKDMGIIQDCLQRVVDLFSEQVFQPVPISCFPACQVINAFRFMQKAEHIGKIVIEQPPQFLIKEQGCYVITGGHGGIGLKLLEWLLSQGARHIALLGRNKPNQATQSIINKLAGDGRDIKSYQVDIAKVELLKSTLDDIGHQQGEIHGIIHAAGVIDDHLFLDQNNQSFDSTWAKAQGAWNLHQLSQHMPLDFFMMFSSMVSLLGSPGQANYAVANAYLDGLAHYRKHMGLPALSINWGAWAEVGMAQKEQERHIKAGVIPMPVTFGLKALQHYLSMPLSQLMVADINWEQFLSGTARYAPWLKDLLKRNRTQTAKHNLIECLERAEIEERNDVLFNIIEQVLKETLKIKPNVGIDPLKGFFDMGMDSLVAMEFRSRIQNEIGDIAVLPNTLSFDHPNLDSILKFLKSSALSEYFSSAVDKTESSEEIVEDEDNDAKKQEIAAMLRGMSVEELSQWRKRK